MLKSFKLTTPLPKILNSLSQISPFSVAPPFTVLQYYSFTVVLNETMMQVKNR